MPRLFILFVLMLSALTLNAHAQASDSLSVQGFVTNSGGIPVPNGNYAILFKLYRNGTAVWEENHPSVAVTGGVFNVLLGGTTPLDTLAFNTPLELGIKVGTDPEISPRTPLTAAAYAKALPGLYTFYREEGNDKAFNVVGGYDNVVAPDVTGATIGGGGGYIGPGSAENVANADYATIGGGYSNTVSGRMGTVSGGYENVAGAQTATVAGGSYNSASGSSASVGGGYNNHATATYSTVPGGFGNVARARESFAAGAWARANHAGSFVWNDVAGGGIDDSLATTDPGQFLIQASGGVGIGRLPTTDMNLDDLNNDGLTEFMLTRAANQFVLSGDGSITSSGDLSLFTDYQSRLTIYQNGQVGINSATPSEGVEVEVGDVDGNDNAFTQWRIPTPDSRLLVGIWSSIGGGLISMQTNDPLAFRTNSLERLRITDAGLIGIGTTNPAARLHVLRASSTSIPQLRIESTNTTASDFARIRMTNSNTSNYWDIAAGATLNNELNFFNATRGNIISLRSTGTPLVTYNGATLTTGGVWTNASSVDRKTDFTLVNQLDVLERLSEVPIQGWRYKVESDNVRHIGPTAQDFREVFGLGESSETIGTVDADGVAMAAIQGLYELVKEQRTLIEGQQAEIDRLRQLVEAANSRSLLRQ